MRGNLGHPERHPSHPPAGIDVWTLGSDSFVDLKPFVDYVHANAVHPQVSGTLLNTYMYPVVVGGWLLRDTEPVRSPH